MLKYWETSGRNVKRLGILVDEQTVAQYALKSGISKTGKELTQQQKLQARYGAIMEQTAKAQGDLARTMDSPTNQLRRLNAEFDMAKIALGQALQPALIAVLPVMSSFARGLTNMLKGGGVSTGNPFSDVVVSLASATATVSTGVSTLTQETVSKVNELKAQVETALNEYAAAASETKTAYIDITMKPKSTAYMRILGVFTQLNKQIDTAQTLLLKDEIKEKLDVILQDGEVTGPEQKSLLDYLTEVEAGLKTEAEDKLKAIQAKAKYQLNTGEIDLPTADQMLIDAQTAYDATIGTIESLIALAKANVNISGWTMPSLSPEDRELLRSVMQTTMDKELAVALTAKATASALFEGTGSVENVVEGVYSNALTLLEAKRQQISDLMNNSIDADWDWSKINGLRQEMADIISFITTGITPQGEFNKALFDLQKLSPESLTSFANAYKNTLNTMSAAEQEQLKMREDLLFSLNAAGDVLGVQDVLDQYGYKSFDEAILDIRKQSADSGAYAQGGFLSRAADAMVPQLQSLMNNAKTLEEVNFVKDMIFEMLSAVDYSNLNEDAKKAVQSLVNIMDNDKVRLMFGSDTNFFGVIDDYLRQIYRENYGKGGGVPMPNTYRVGDDNTPPAWYSQPRNLTNPWQPAVIPEIVIDKPKVELKDPGYVSSKGWMSPGSVPPQSVNVDVETSDVTLNIDGRAIAAAVIKYLPKVQAQSGKPVYSYGGRNIDNVMVLDR